jgi:hypothetical protein
MTAGESFADAGVGVLAASTAHWGAGCGLSFAAAKEVPKQKIAALAAAT